MNSLTYVVIVLDGSDPSALTESYRKSFRAHERAQADAFARRVTTGIGGRPCAQVWNGANLVLEVNSKARERWLLSVAKWSQAA